MKYFMLIWAGLWRKKASTILTMLSIVIAFLLFGLLQGFNQGLSGAFTSLNVENIFVQNRITTSDALPIAYLERIKAVPHVQAITHWTFFGGYFREAKNDLDLFAADVDGLLKVYNKFKIPKEQVDAMRSTRTGMLISKGTAEEFGWKIGDRIPVGSSVWRKKNGDTTWYFDVVGIYDGSAYGAIFGLLYINYDYFDEERAGGNGEVHYYIASLDDPRRGDEVIAAIDKQFANSNYETKSQSQQAWTQSIVKQMADVNYIVNSIVSAVLFTLLFLTANTMLQSVRERIPELAVLKALGFSDMKVLALILVESAALCVFASIIGLLLARVAFSGIGAIFGSMVMPFSVVAMGIAIALALALVSGLPPALRAKRLSIVDALAER